MVAQRLIRVAALATLLFAATTAPTATSLLTSHDSARSWTPSSRHYSISRRSRLRRAASMQSAATDAYGADQITVLEGLEPVRKRPVSQHAE